MDSGIWLTYCLAATLVLVIPGPTIILVMSQAIAHGRKAVLPSTLGVALGDLTAMVCSLVGLGAVLAASAALFTLFKWIGAVYLIYLGLQLLRTRPGVQPLEMRQIEGSDRSLFQRAFVVTALNPKSIVFFVAFMPQFVDARHNGLVQLCILGITFLVLATVNAFLYGLFAGQLREAMRSRRMKRIFEICGGSALVGTGIITATFGRAQ